MDALIFLVILAVFTIVRGIPADKRRELLLRLEYELHKRGFIDYRDV